VSSTDFTAGGAEASTVKPGFAARRRDGLEDRLDAVDGGRAAVGELVLDEDGVSVRGDERGSSSGERISETPSTAESLATTSATTA
jgi:hypothetical protein